MDTRSQANKRKRDADSEGKDLSGPKSISTFTSPSGGQTAGASNIDRSSRRLSTRPTPAKNTGRTKHRLNHNVGAGVATLKDVRGISSQVQSVDNTESYAINAGVNEIEVLPVCTSEKVVQDVNNEDDEAEADDDDELEGEYKAHPVYASVNAFGVNMDENVDSEPDNVSDGEDTADDVSVSDKDEYTQEDADNTLSESQEAGESILPTSYENLYPDPVYYDGSKPYKDPNHAVSDFHMALMIFCTSVDISTTQYVALREVLQFVRNTSDITSLPANLVTLKDRCRRNLPLMKLRGYDLSIDTDKVPPKSETPKKAYRFELAEYAKLIMSDPGLVSNMYFGPAILDLEERSEVWHGDMWASSLRTTSGIFPHLDSDPVLPSDCIVTSESKRFRVTGTGMIGTGPNKGKLGILGHRLRKPSEVKWPPNKTYSTMIMEVDRLAAKDPHPICVLSTPLNPLIMMEDETEIIPIESVTQKFWVRFMDYDIGDKLENSLLPKKPEFCIKYIAYRDMERKPDEISLRPIYKRHRLPAERELIEYGRSHALDCFVARGDKPRIVSLPISFFLDDFGLYRGSYHSIAGLYFQPWCLNETQRYVVQNMFVLMVAPFGSNDLDLAMCLEDEGGLGAGSKFQLADGETVNLIMFPMAFTGDMPQQTKNAGLMSHKSLHGCRNCHITSVDRKKKQLALNFDTIWSGRYHCERDRQIKSIQESKTIKSRTAKVKALNSLGLHEDGHIFEDAFPCLDPCSNYPNDPMHSEIRLSMYFQAMLIDHVFSSAGIKAYRLAWNQVEVPYGWGQPQNPVSHRKSMVFCENGRIAQLLPMVLLMMFTDPSTGKKFGGNKKGKSFFRGIGTKSKGPPVATRMKEIFGVANQDYDPSDTLIEVSYETARVIYLSQKAVLTKKEIAELPGIMLNQRRLLARLFTSVEKKEEFAHCQNVHLGMHWKQDLLNYGTLRNVAVMIGEQLHKIHKTHAKHTNSQDTELQLLKLVNLVSSIRFIVNGVYNGHPMAEQAAKILNLCPTIRSKFVPSTTNKSSADYAHEGNIDMEGVDTAYACINVSAILKQRATPMGLRTTDLKALKPVYSSCNGGFSLFDGIRGLKIHYYKRAVGTLSKCGRVQKISIKVGAAIQLKPKETRTWSYGMVMRIMRVILTHANTSQLYIIVKPLIRAVELEDKCAGYEVYVDNGSLTELIDIASVFETQIHMMDRKISTAKYSQTYWLNCFVTHFL